MQSLIAIVITATLAALAWYLVRRRRRSPPAQPAPAKPFELVALMEHPVLGVIAKYRGASPTLKQIVAISEDPDNPPWLQPVDHGPADPARRDLEKVHALLHQLGAAMPAPEAGLLDAVLAGVESLRRQRATMGALLDKVAAAARAPGKLPSTALPEWIAALLDAKAELAQVLEQADDAGMSFAGAVMQLRAGLHVKRPGMDGHLVMRSGIILHVPTTPLFAADGWPWPNSRSLDDVLASDWLLVPEASVR